MKRDDTIKLFKSSVPHPLRLKGGWSGGGVRLDGALKVFIIINLYGGSAAEGAGWWHSSESGFQFVYDFQNK